MRDREIHTVMRTLEQASHRWHVPVVELVAERSKDPFQILISCHLSLRTKDDVTRLATRRLLAKGKTPTKLLSLPLAKIRRLIFPVGFYRTKAKRIHEICRELLTRFHGKVPDSLEELLTLPGVGRKTANLVLTVAFDKLGICVDTHVHRISNRLGYVRTKGPLETEWSLRKKLPKRYWNRINLLLVTLGQAICHPLSPRCSQCPIERYCGKVGVVRSR